MKTHPFCNSTKSRHDRSRVSDLRAEEFEDLILLNDESVRIGNQIFGILTILVRVNLNFSVYSYKSISASGIIFKLNE